MPTRMIREGILDSERYAQLSDQGKLFFHHLLLLADDLGCVSLSPAYLRRRCFYDAPGNERIAKLIIELIDVDLIRTYECDRRALAFIPKFGQRLRFDKPKYPFPPAVLYQDDLDASKKFNDMLTKMSDRGLTDVRQLTDGRRPEVEGKGSRREVEGNAPSERPSPGIPDIPGLPQGKNLYEWAMTQNIKAKRSENSIDYRDRIIAEWLARNEMPAGKANP